MIVSPADLPRFGALGVMPVPSPNWFYFYVLFNSGFSVLMIPSAGETSNAGYWLEKGNELCNSGQGQEALKAYDHALEGKAGRCGRR
ncbi:MAG: hypothetical protein A4E49_00720 [Methanosaeta sp. PtaU1.Bin112]|nr:MAG: hypothetical protein A4E49_00720 [Methanosaeta sp. PtaU1.Bin112]